MSWFREVFLGLPPKPNALVGTGIVSPWQDSSSLAHIAYSELFSGGADIVDRTAAMRVAPIKRGRAILVGSIADLPLQSGAWTEGAWVSANRQPAWLNSTKTIESVWDRMAWTVDDLMFYGWSLWALERSEAGTITAGARVPQSRWSFDESSPLGIKVNDRAVTDPRSVILFRGPDEGLLSCGADVIRGARAMERAWVGRVQNPIPAMVLHETERNGVTENEAKAYVKTWSEARTSPNGAVGFLPSTLNMEVYGDTVADLFTEGRNNVRLDVANILNLPASLLDGSTATASLTYQTAQGEFSQLTSWLEYWLAPIESRLSMDDITPRGQVVRFDRSNLSSVPADTHGPELTAEPEPETPALEAA